MSIKHWLQGKRRAHRASTPDLQAAHSVPFFNKPLTDSPVCARYWVPEISRMLSLPFKAGEREEQVSSKYNVINAIIKTDNYERKYCTHVKCCKLA